MASKSLVLLATTLVLCASNALGSITCDDLGVDACAYAVSSSGMRCVLEKQLPTGGGPPQEAYSCTTSEIGAEGLNDWVETQACVDACGLDRYTVGISSDSLLDTNFRRKLCSAACYRGCPNVINLYFNLAAGEGLFLPELCEAQQTDARQATSEMRSGGELQPAAGAPVPTYYYAEPPTRDVYNYNAYAPSPALYPADDHAFARAETPVATFY